MRLGEGGGTILSLGNRSKRSCSEPGSRRGFPVSGPGTRHHAIPAKPEGVALIKESSHHWEILVVFDGLKDGHATRFRVEKP